MTHLDTELAMLKSATTDMWLLVISQLEKARTSIINFDKDLANDIEANEKRVDAYELKLNMDCENILALFYPLAIDLRFVLAVLKINYNLERIGDYANCIGRIVDDSDERYSSELWKITKIEEMFTLALSMLTEALEAFETENNLLARKLFKKDELLDKINDHAATQIAELIKKNPEDVKNLLHAFTIIRRLERVGDQVRNIAEEIIFFKEAKVLRHSKTKQLPDSDKKNVKQE